MKAIRDASSQALHHFTRFDQVNQLVSASEADPALGFMGRTMALCSLPRTNPGNRLQYKRVNGPFTLYMQSGPGNKLPYANLPRLILAWVCTEAVRTRCRELVLGRSLSEFMRTLDIYSNSGRVHTRLRNQMKRLFGCTVTMIYEEPGGFARVSSFVADKHEFWWNERKPNVPSLWESKIELGEKFFNEIISHPVPLDMNTLTALKRSSLGLDLYLWLVYRTFALRAPKRLTWRLLYSQFGAHPANASAPSIHPARLRSATAPASATRPNQVCSTHYRTFSTLCRGDRVKTGFWFHGAELRGRDESREALIGIFGH